MGVRNQARTAPPTRHFLQMILICRTTLVFKCWSLCLLVNHRMFLNIYSKGSRRSWRPPDSCRLMVQRCTALRRWTVAPLARQSEQPGPLQELFGRGCMFEVFMMQVK